MQPVKLIIVTNPLEPKKGRKILDLDFAGQDLRDIIEQYAVEHSEIIVFINQKCLDVRPKKDYGHSLKPGDEIVIVPAIKDIIGGVYAVATWVATTLGYETVSAMLWSAAVSVGISIGAAYLIKAIGSGISESDFAVASQSYSWNPATLQQQGLVVPRAYGQNKCYGNIISCWTEPDNDNDGLSEILYLLMGLGTGPVEGIVDDSIQVNDQPISNFSYVNAYERRGLITQDYIFDESKLQYNPQWTITNDGGALIWITPDNDFDKLEISLGYSGYYYRESGKRGQITIDYKIEISEHNADSWTTLVDDTFILYSAMKQVNFKSNNNYTGGTPVTIENGKRYDIRVTKDSGDIDIDRAKNDLKLMSVREVINTAFTYPNLAILGIEAIATEQLSGSLKVSCVQQGRVMNVYNGSEWIIEYSNNPAWVIWDILTQPVIRGNQTGCYPILQCTTPQEDPGLPHTIPISNFAELQAMENDLTGNYYLTGDIDASGDAFDKIGTNVNDQRFTGTFDGCGYTISGLNISTTKSYVGLFGCIADGAKIANVTLDDCEISGDSVTGSLIGMIRCASGGSILVQNCHSSGSVSKDETGGSYNYGGLIGQAYAGTADSTIQIYDCSSSCTVTQTSTYPGNQNIGGFVGSITSNCTISNCHATGDVNTNYCGNEAAGFVGSIAIATEGQSGSITYCYATGNVYGENNAGGFCGVHEQGTTISKCYATGTVIGQTSGADNGTGGFIGENSGGETNDCYAWGDVTDNGDGGVGDDCAGGFIGLESSGGGSTVTNCYSIGTATATTLSGGFVGHNAPDITACFWDTEASGNATSDAGIGHITSWMRTQSNYEVAGWDFDDIWEMDDSIAYNIVRYDGIDPARLLPYLAEFYEAAQYYDELVSDGEGGTEKRITFNGIFDAGTNVWDAVQQVCAIARCEIVPMGMNYTIVVDKPWTGPAIQLFSAGNIVPDSFRTTYLPLDDRAGEVEIEYIDSQLDYEMTPLLYCDPLINNPNKKLTLNGFGINRASQAWRTVYYELAKNRLLKSTSEFKARIDAIVCAKGDVIAVRPPWRYGGRIISCPASNQLIVDNALMDSGSDTIIVRVHDPETGADSVETHSVSHVDGTVVTISDTWTNNPKKDDIFAFGPTNDVTKLVRVIGLSESGELDYKIKVIEYNENVYAGDDLDPEIPIQGYVTPQSAPSQTRPITSGRIQDTYPPETWSESNYDSASTTNISFDNNPSAGSIAWSAEDSETELLFTIAGVDYEITASGTTKKYIYWDSNYSTEFKSTDDFYEAVGPTKWLICINDNGYAWLRYSCKAIHGDAVLAGPIIDKIMTYDDEILVYDGNLIYSD